MATLFRTTIMALLAVWLYGTVLAAEEQVELRDGHPTRYTVVKGDTLWDISTRFLKSPWLWPRIWKINKQIANPHLIYPGDIILLRWVGGRPEISVVRGGEPGVAKPDVDRDVDIDVDTTRPTILGATRLRPRVRVLPLSSAIPTIPPDAINPFLTRPSIVTRRQMRKAGYITIGLDNRLVLGNGSEFYARGFKKKDLQEDQYFHIMRRGKPLRGARSRRILAYEAVYLGEAQMIEVGDPAKLVVTRVVQEILPTDRLIIAPKRPVLLYYFPRPPRKQVKGSVIHALNSVGEIGPYTIVVVDLGTKHGLEEGHVLYVLRHVGKHRDPVKKRLYRIPDEQSGVIMIFSPHERVSYGLVMTAKQPINLLDTVVTP